jgi:hypothetical protein
MESSGSSGQNGLKPQAAMGANQDCLDVELIRGILDYRKSHSTQRQKA